MSHVLTLATPRSCLLFVRGGVHRLFALDGYHLAALRGTATWRDSVAEYIPHWATSCCAPPATAAATARVSAVPVHAHIAGDSVEEVPVTALAERVGDFNISMDPWEQTGAAPQGWAPAPDCDSSPGPESQANRS